MKSLPKRVRQDGQKKEPDGRQQIVLFTGSSEKMAILYAMRLAADSQKRFKVLVAVSSLFSVESLSETKVLKYLNSTLFMLQMDISDDEDVRSLVQRITDEDGCLDAVVISSDIRLSGPLEEHTSSQIESLFESNVYSTTRIIRVILPVLKRQNHGNILVTNTQAGICGMPFHSAYSATKFAVNGLLESLAPECLRFNIYVSILETSISNESDKNAKAIRLAMENDTSALDGDTVHYYENFNVRLKRSRESMKKPNPVKLADVVKNILLSPKPHFRYQINRVCKEAVQNKLTDKSGDTFIEETAQKYLE